MMNSIQISICVFLFSILVSQPANAKPLYQNVEQSEEAERLRSEGIRGMFQPDYEEAIQKLNAALVIYQEIEDIHAEAAALHSIGQSYHFHRNNEQAFEYYEQAISLWQTLGEVKSANNTLYDQGMVYGQIGDEYYANSQYESAVIYYQKAVTILNELDRILSAARWMNQMAVAYYYLARYQEALVYYEEVLTFRQSSGDMQGQGVVLKNIGAVYYELGSYDKAIDHFKQAKAIFETVDDSRQLASTLNNLGAAYRVIDDYKSAKIHLSLALKLFKELNDLSGQGTTLSHLGAIHHHQGRYDLALERYVQALEMSDDWIDESTLYNNIGAVYLARGQYALALETYMKALRIIEKVDGLFVKGGLYSSIGGVYQSMGQYRQALEYHLKALAIAQEIGERVTEADALNSLGVAYYRLGDLELALSYYEQAEEIYQEIGDRSRVAEVLSRIGGIFYGLGRYEAALPYYEEALKIAELLDIPKERQNILKDLSLLYVALGEYEQALTTNQKALALSRDIRDWVGESIALYQLGSFYTKLGEYEKALIYYQDALNLTQKISNTETEGSILYEMGVVYERLGDREKAIHYYKQAIEVIEEMQGTIKVEEYVASFITVNNNVYARLINLLWVNQPLEAFKYMERARARTFLDQIGNQRIDSRRDDTAEITGREQQLRLQITHLEQEIRNESSKPIDQQNQEQIGEPAQDLIKAQNDYRKLLADLKVSHPEYAALITIETVTIEEIQHNILDDQTTLIEYFVMNDRVLAWVVDHEQSELIEIASDRADLHRQIKFLRELLNEKDIDRNVTKKLYDIFLAPLMPHIQYENLIIIPHDQLHYLTFAALWNAEDQRYFGEEYTVRYAPSASALKYIQQKENPNEGRLIAFGNSDGSLPKAANEVKEVAALYEMEPILLDAATENQLYELAPQADILHLAAHGTYNAQNAMFSSIKLADGNLEVHEIYSLDLSQANLVTLSACDTMQGELTGGDEIIGLTRAFFYAGAPTVLSTLWAVNDEATAALMVAFYRNWRDEDMTKAEALQAAQAEIRSQEKWASPYYWAGFVLNGHSETRPTEKNELMTWDEFTQGMCKQRGWFCRSE